MLTWQEDQEYEVHELLHVSQAAKGTREESGEKWKGLLPKSSLLFPLLALPEGMSTRTWHLFHPAYWAIHQAFLSWAENSGISIARSQPRFSLDSLKESIMWWPETMVLGVPLSSAVVLYLQALHGVNFWKAKRERVALIKTLQVAQSASRGWKESKDIILWVIYRRRKI